MQPHSDRAGDRRHTNGERAFWALVALVLAIWLLGVEGGLAR
jgi:hypothetical protein